VKYLICILISLFAFTINVNAQEKKTKPKLKFKITGSFGLYGDFYKMKSDTVGAIAPRRPAFLGRAVANTTFSYGKFSLPFTMSMSSTQRSPVISTPSIPTGNFFKDFKNNITNPLNRIGIAPKYKWAQLLLGSQIPAYSELSVGDISVFGAGIALTPGKFRFSAFAGKSQTAINPDSARGIAGVYARKIYSVKIGVGHEDSSHIYLIGSKLNDDTNSINLHPVSLLPQAGFLSSLDFRINMGKKVYFKGEIAGSAFTRNQYSSEVANFNPQLPRSLFITRLSSRLDYASILTLGKEGKIFGIKTTGKYYGDGFVPMGYPFLQTDRAEITIDPKLTLKKGKISLSGAIGKRINNLSGIRGTTTAQTIGNANMNIQFSDAFSLAANFSNFGIRNNQTNDTLKVEMVTNSWSVSPNYTYSNDASSHNFMFMYAQNTFADFNTITGALNNNDAINGVFSYSITMLKNPLSISTIISYFDNNTSFGKLQTNSANLSAGYSFLKKKLKTTLGLTLADNKFNNVANGFQTMLSSGIKYTLKKKINFGLNGSINLYKYGAAKPGISYKENLLRTSITYQF